MKNKSILILLSMIFIVVMKNQSFAKNIFGGKETVVIQTSAICGECKSRIESALLELKGVSNAKLNLKDKKVTVTYDSTKVSIAEIKTAISKAGYDADDVKADATAYQNLPACCKKGGHD